MSQPALALRDIHWPDPVSWWPPAPGWWLLGLLILLVLLSSAWAIRVMLKPSVSREAKQHLQRITSEWLDTQHHEQYLQQLSRLLRQIGMTYLGRAEVAGLHGNDWWQRLNQLSRQAELQPPLTSLLAEQQYRRDLSLDPAQVEAINLQLQRWLKGLPKKVPAKRPGLKPRGSDHV